MNFNLDYAIASAEKKQTAPALQVDNYRVKKGDVINWAISLQSAELINDTALSALTLAPVECEYNLGKVPVPMLKLPDTVRWVLAGRPLLFTEQKDGDRHLRLLQRGENLAELNRRTVSKLFLGCVVDKKLLLQDDQSPLIFSLKLTGLKTFLTSHPTDKELKTFEKLNSKLCELAKTTDVWLCHLAAVSLEPHAELFGTAQQSYGINYKIGDAKALLDGDQKIMFDYINSEKFKAINADPFGIGGIAPGTDLPF